MLSRDSPLIRIVRSAGGTVVRPRSGTFRPKDAGRVRYCGITRVRLPGRRTVAWQRGFRSASSMAS
jgi:hypothetical protein